MLLILGLIALTIVVLAGFGAALSGRRPSELAFFDLALRGLLAVTTLGLIANFFLPLSASLVIAIGAAGVVCFVFHRALLWRSLGPRPGAMLILLAALLALDVIGVLVTPLSYDTGLYHLQLVEWLEHGPRVFGLANLHHRFGVNSIWFLDVAMFDFIRQTHEGVFLLNAALFTMVAGALMQPILRSSARLSPPRIADLYAVVILAVLLVNAPGIMFNQLFAGPENDLPGALLVVYGFSAFLRSFEAAGDRQSRFVSLLVAATLAVMIKITTAPVLLLLPVAGYGIARDRRAAAALARDPVLICLVVAAIAWVAAGLISSGCIVFPMGSSCIAGLPWAVPPADVSQFATLIKAWARSPNGNFQEAATGWAWLADWPRLMLARRAFLPGTSWSFAMVASVGIAVALIERWRCRTATVEGSGISAIVSAILIAGLGNLFWFAMAPDPRFGIGFLLALPALLIAAAIWAVAVDGSLTRLLAHPCLLIGLVLVSLGLFAWHHGGPAARAAGSWPSIPYAPVAAKDFGPAFPVNVPLTGDQCWDAPRPCAPPPVPGAPPLHDRRWLLWYFIEPG